eukprot:266199_1
MPSFMFKLMWVVIFSAPLVFAAASVGTETKGKGTGNAATDNTPKKKLMSPKSAKFRPLELLKALLPMPMLPDKYQTLKLNHQKYKDLKLILATDIKGTKVEHAAVIGNLPLKVILTT